MPARDGSSVLQARQKPTLAARWAVVHKGCEAIANV